jgi:hypothetical protein
VRDAAAMPPTVSEPRHNHAICTSVHVGKIVKLAEPACRGHIRCATARVAIKVDKGNGSA